MEAEAGRILFLGARLRFETDRGSFILVTFPREAPKTVEQITRLVREGFYDGLAVHRLVRNVAVQMGDPGTRTLPPGDAKVGRGGSGKTLPPEFSGQSVRYLAGTVGLARGKDPQSGDSQFFITVAPAPHLDENYTIFGHVVHGMDVVRLLTVGDRIKKASVLQEDPGAPPSTPPSPSPTPVP
jgi:cyclophilin family peptidyl-prolyl cis-trans isomerase